VVQTVGEWVAAPADARSVSLTFDDGWAGSLSSGVAALAEAGFQATFFVTRDFVGTRNFADAQMLQDAHAAGMELGTHGVTHRFLSDCSELEIREELAGSKAFLEDLLGAPVDVGSVPGGAWSPLVGRIARECGYRALCTSRPGVNDATTDPMQLRRVPIRRETDAATVRRYADGEVRREAARAAVLELPRRILGRERYARLRARLMGD
jgi:peptidoglycan/xylan/chitin deacetylase (PgdA/CDA1 family)